MLPVRVIPLHNRHSGPDAPQTPSPLMGEGWDGGDAPLPCPREGGDPSSSQRNPETLPVVHTPSRHSGPDAPQTPSPLMGEGWDGGDAPLPCPREGGDPSSSHRNPGTLPVVHTPSRHSGPRAGIQGWGFGIDPNVYSYQYGLALAVMQGSLRVGT